MNRVLETTTIFANVILGAGNSEFVLVQEKFPILKIFKSLNYSTLGHIERQPTLIGNIEVHRTTFWFKCNVAQTYFIL